MKGVVHRDLKHSNVLVAVTEAGPRVRIIDFAMANANGIGLRMPRFRPIRRGDPLAESPTMKLRARVAVGLAGLAGLIGLAVTPRGWGRRSCSLLPLPPQSSPRSRFRTMFWAFFWVLPGGPWG